MNGKPIIIYTIELFDNHPDIDGIVVVCLESWIPFLQKMLKKFEITRVVSVTPGGDSGQDSIFKGLCAAEEYAKEKNKAKVSTLKSLRESEYFSIIKYDNASFLDWTIDGLLMRKLYYLSSLSLTLIVFLKKIKNKYL